MSALLEIKSPDRGRRLAAFNAISRKRLDYLLTNSANQPVCALEFQGGGHWQGGSRKRDAVKKSALARAGLPLIEVHPDWDEHELVSQLDSAIKRGRFKADPGPRRRTA